jgi:hypothetical protein
MLQQRLRTPEGGVPISKSSALVTVAARVDAAARRINALSKAATLQVAFEIGEAVIETMYDGRMSQWRTRGRKELGLRQLASHPKLCISASTLYRSIAIYELCTRLDCRASLRHLGVSHLRAVLHAPHAEQGMLVARAEHEAWSVARLEREVTHSPLPSQARGGRPRSPSYVKSIRRMGQLTEPEALEGLDAVDSLEPEVARELLRVVGRIRERISLIELVLGRPAREPRHSELVSRAKSA